MHTHVSPVDRKTTCKLSRSHSIPYHHWPPSSSLSQYVSGSQFLVLLIKTMCVCLVSVESLSCSFVSCGFIPVFAPKKRGCFLLDESLKNSGKKTCTVVVYPRISHDASHYVNGHFRNLNWRYLHVPTIYKAYVRAMVQGISPQNMANNMVLTYLHFRILNMLVIPTKICWLYSNLHSLGAPKTYGSFGDDPDVRIHGYWDDYQRVSPCCPHLPGKSPIFTSPIRLADMMYI